MGAWNYAKSEFFKTLGMNTNIYDYEDTEIIEEIDRDTTIVKEDCLKVFEEYEFKGFYLNLLNGYYDGVYVTIEDIREDETDKTEIEKLKECLTNLLDCGLVVCEVGWGTHFYDYAESLELIKKI